MRKKLTEYLLAELEAYSIEYRVHATQRMFSRSIEEIDVRHVLANGAVVEEYPTDFPFPSILASGTSNANRPLHAVVGIDNQEYRLYIITIYEPDPEKWSKNFSTRKSP